MVGILVEVFQRNLMSSKRSLNLFAIDFVGTGPAFGRVEDDHGPTGTVGESVFARFVLNGLNFGQRQVHGFRHELEHVLRFMPGDEVGVPTVAAKQFGQLAFGDAREDCGVGDLVSIEMEDWQDCAIAYRVQKFVAMPAGGQRTGFRFAITDDTAHQKIGVVEGRAECVGKRVTEFATLMDGAGRFGGDMARNATGEGKLFEEPADAFFIAADVRVIFGVRAFQVDVGDNTRAPVPRPGDIDGVQVMLDDEPIHLDVDEIQTGRGAPVAEQARFDVFKSERLTEQRIFEQINLADRKIVGGAPIRVHLAEFIGGERAWHPFRIG